ncbi:hypothetical protein BGX31_008373 [Mortierella sp. GBA43]|nr:hypothetical protein BGX31_008373 [Mortierella sp. GBA43]
MVFLISLYFTWVWVLTRLHFIELPFHLLTGFNYSSKQHPVSWPWWSSVMFAIVRAGAIKCQTMGQIRVTGLIISTFMPLQMVFTKDVKVTKNVKFKVKLDTLLRHERVTLKETREAIRSWGHSDDPFSPSEEYLASMHPGGPNTLANLPEEAGIINPDGTYTLQCEWIEALDPDHHDPRPMNKTVILYFHGGAHVFCSTASHRHMLAQLAKDVGPGTRIFSVGYRLAPEHPFPAAIHDAFAAYLYLTEPKHEALVLDERSAAREMGVDPRDLVIAGDSAGGNLAVAFMQYMNMYVQPSVTTKFVLPHAAILLSQNYASLYVCGDPKYGPNYRNAFGRERRWEWYTHLTQHPLVSIAFSNKGALSGMTDTLIQAATHDRLVDDSRLIAHRIGLENSLENMKRMTRIEVYKDMVHVHQFMFFLFLSGRIAFKNVAQFIQRSISKRDRAEFKAAAAQGKIAGKHPRSYADVAGEGTTSGDHHDRSYAEVAAEGSSSAHAIAEEKTAGGESQAVLRRPPQEQGEDDDNNEGNQEYPTSDTSSDDFVPTFPDVGVGRSWTDGVEWVLVEQDGRQTEGDEGAPMSILRNAWGTDDDGIGMKEEEEEEEEKEMEKEE